MRFRYLRRVFAFLLSLLVWFYGIWGSVGFSEQVYDLGYPKGIVHQINDLSTLEKKQFLKQKPSLTLTELIELCLEDKVFSQKEATILDQVNQHYPNQTLSPNQAKFFHYLTKLSSKRDFFSFGLPLDKVAKIKLDPGMLEPQSIFVYQRNESRIPILMYHSIDGSKVGIKKEEFLEHLNLLYEHGYSTLSLHDYQKNDFSKIPEGRKPVILTFDDGWISQFSYTDYQGTRIDPNSVVGILESFYKKNPLFGKNAAFVLYLSILPFTLSLSHYKEGHLWKQKIQYLLQNGFEVGCHTYHHQYLGTVSYSKFKQELDQFFRTIAPIVQGSLEPLMFFAYPGGIYPKDMKWIREYTYQNNPLQFSLSAFGGNARIPFSQNPDIYKITRILGENIQVQSVAKQKSFSVHRYKITLPKMMLTTNELLAYWLSNKTGYSLQYLLTDPTIIYTVCQP